jgi:hypothetical protein
MGALEDAKAAVNAARANAGSATTDPATGKEKPPPIWLSSYEPNGGYEAIGSASAWANRQPSKNVVEQKDVLKYVYGMTGNPAAWQEYTQALYEKGALYDMQYARNVGSVIDATNMAMQMYTNSGAKQSFIEWVRDPSAGMIGVDKKKADPGLNGSLGGTSTNTTTRVDLSNPDTAKGLVNTALTQHLGRAANPQEVSDFYAALQAHEKMNPQTGSSTTETSNQQMSGKQVASATTTNDVTGGGTNAQQFADDWAKAQEGSAEYTAATTYMDAFLQAIKAPV